jgi:signal transduction histidine kinase
MIIIGFVGFGGYVFSRQALSPVADMMQQIDAVFPAQIGKRLDVTNSKDELSRLAGMFNQLLDRAEEAFLNQKGFLSNISHEIKNPLTAIISRLDVLLQKERSPAEYQAVLSSTLTDMHELKEISEQLMQLGKISSGDNNPSFQNLRLDELVWQVNSDIMKIHPGYKIYLDTSDLPEDPDRLNIKGNEQLLKTAISNLCVNACKFSSDHSAYLYILFR